MTDTDDFKYNCEICNYHSNKLSNFQQHENTKKHKRNTSIVDKIVNEFKYNCEICNYHTNNKFGFYQHNRTKKHIKNIGEEIKDKEQEKYGLIYLINVVTYEKDENDNFKQIFKFGYSKKNNKDRLNCYSSTCKINKELLTKSIKHPKKCESYIKKNIKHFKYYEKSLSNSGEYFNWSYCDNEKENIINLTSIVNKIVNEFDVSNSFLSISEFNNISL